MSDAGQTQQGAPASGRRGSKHPAPKVDVVAAVRGASTGFSVLLLGGAIAPLVEMAVPIAALLWLPLVALTAFAVAGARTGSANSSLLQGAIAAVGSYLLILPIVVIVPSGRDALQITMTLVAAVLAGSVAGRVHRWYRDHRQHS
ncbi:hypothetical protein [Saccharopolyspora sp. NPDC049426]|uniref:hypothetical protein n=1 Tax=Saccharopolyspora sp. NPDC049426 TaxID=3155652 RepID=UPI00342893DA